MTRYEKQEILSSDWRFCQEIFMYPNYPTFSPSIANELGYCIMKAVKSICKKLIENINIKYNESWDIRDYDIIVPLIVHPDKIKTHDAPSIDFTSRYIVEVLLNLEDINNIRRKLRDNHDFRQSRIGQDNPF